MKGNRFLVLIVLVALIAGCVQQTTPIPATATVPPETATETPVPVTATPSLTTMPPTTAAVTPTTEPGHYPPPRSPEPGEAYRFENLASVTFVGVNYRIECILIAKRDVLPPEYYAYSPLLAGKETVIYLKLVASNQGGAKVNASAAGMLTLGNEEQTLDTFRLQDYIEAGTILPHPQSWFLDAGEQYTVGFWLGTDVPPDEITHLKLVLSCPTAEGQPNCLGVEVGLRDVILDADLPVLAKPGLTDRPWSQDQPLAQIADYSQALARSDLGTLQEISDGLTAELLRLFIAPSEAVPEIADLLPADTQSATFVGTVVHIAYRFTNTSDKPLVLNFLDTMSFYWHFVPPGQPDQLQLDSFYASGLSVGKEPDGWGSLQIQPGQAVITGIWFGLPTPFSELGGELFWIGGCVTPVGVETGPETCKGEIRYDTASPWAYQPFPETQEPAIAGPVLPEIPVCQNEQQIQTALQAAIPQDQWGLKYQTNGSNPPEMKFIGVASGQVDKITVSGRGPFEQETLDLARLYFLSADGSPGSLWVAVGMTSTTTLPDVSGSTYTSFGNQGWRSSEQAQATFSQPGKVFEAVISDWYVQPNGIHWEQCYRVGAAHEKSQYTWPFVCDAGLILDKGGSAQFFSTGVPPEGWLAYGWGLYPNEAAASVTLPGGCP
jgi:hypothetical protein